MAARSNYYGTIDRNKMELSAPDTASPPSPPDMAKRMDVAVKYKIDIPGPPPEEE